MLRRINISAALIVVICFFLPWEQVSCGGAHDALNGWELARHDQWLLFLIPLLMLAVIVVGLVRDRNERPGLLGIISIITGGVTALLMNRQRMRVQDESGIISAQLTGWFWLSFLSALAVTIMGFVRLFRRRPSA
jgi:hypothetical protein